MPSLLGRLVHVVVPNRHRMSRTQFSLFRILYLLFTALWLAVLLGIWLVWRAPGWVKVIATLLLGVVTPTLDGPWRYTKYAAWWESEQEKLKDARSSW
jgi:uncharacterized membrane protein YqjE